MSIQQQVLANAAKRIGYYAPNDPNPGSEAGRYWTARGKGAWLSGPSRSIWWCMLFVSMCLDEAGQIGAIGGFSYNTDVTIRQARAAGCPFVSVDHARPGDVVIFNWDGGGTDHVGFVEKNLGGGWLQTIEGNTSSGSGGSQSAGNGVWRRQRNHSIAAVIRPRYTGTSDFASPKISFNNGEPLVVDGTWGVRTTAKFQGYMGTFLDGIVSDQASSNSQYVPAAGSGWEWVGSPSSGSALIRAVQKKVGSSADGIIGPNTVSALQRHLGVGVDGYAGPKTVSALQYRLNAKSF